MSSPDYLGPEFAGNGAVGQPGAAGQAQIPTGGNGVAAGTTGGAPFPAGTGASGAGAGASGAGGSTPADPPDGGMPGLPIPPQCQGIEFNDIRYSPGGTALPNSCEPFHPTLNNPYAVRCVDAWPWYETGYVGDEYCILPPPPDKGIQFGFHPQGDGDAWLEQSAAGDMSGYEGLGGGSWELAAGMETNLNYIGGTDNPERHNFYRTYVRMRLGSHHMINSVGGETRGMWGRGDASGLAAGDEALPSVQRTDENRPNSLEKPAEDAGLYRIYPARPNITFNVHHFNSTDQPILRESWTNLWWEEDARIAMQWVSAVAPSQALLLNMGPGTTRDLHYSYSVSEPVRILELFGHRHVWTPNFTAWIERPGGQTEVVYQSFDWFDVPTYRYDSQTQNPAVASQQKISGGHSGVLTLQPDETLHFNCHITFTDARSAATGAPSPQDVGTLRFANEAYTAEMCILFGWSAAVPLGFPVDEAGAPPDFATVD
jgi:hypothetical protein